MTTEYALVAAERTNQAVATLCRVAGVSVSSFYTWLHAIPTVQVRAEAEAKPCGYIGRSLAAKRRAYGSPRIHAELRREGRQHSLRRVEQLMHETGLSAPGPQAGAANHGQPPRPPGSPTLLARDLQLTGLTKSG